VKILRVIDFFCGAGGFSEGFRQQGFKIIMGIDNWRPAVDTHNLNHGLQDTVMDILMYEGEKGIEEINHLEDTEIIIGSPPCVTFSMSNRAGKADKSLGIRLIEAYLRIVAVKKHQAGSILQAWLMENVPNSMNFVKEVYTFKDLDLSEWAIRNSKDPSNEALRTKHNGSGLFTASDFGSPQSRQRFICGEVVRTGNFPKPDNTHVKQVDLFSIEKRPSPTLGDIKLKMPSPIEYIPDTLLEDPNYPGLKIKASELTDHFYDTGLYHVEWEMARAAKINHPFMGRMSFPEDESRPSRTIMATRSASTREAMIFRSEYKRKGDGEFRLPTIREAATLMGFPYTYQFIGSEGTKWRLIGNAVCPHMAAALAKAIRVELGLAKVPDEQIDFSEEADHYMDVQDLKNLQPILFNAPPKKNKGAKFRMHPFKIGNMTVALTNFDPDKKSSPATNGKIWYCAIFLGSGKDYKIVLVTSTLLKKIEERIAILPDGLKYMKEFDKRFLKKIGGFQELQHLLEKNRPSEGKFLAPITLVEELANFIENYDQTSIMLENVQLDGIKKELFPKRQLLAAWALGRVVMQAKELKH
jgi:DNA (cytosine-5)-methyltransferase 1